MGLLAAEPRAQRRILPGLSQGVVKNGVAGVAPGGPVGVENKLGFLIGHVDFPPLADGNGTTFARPAASSRASAARSWALPRDSRDITVPMGTSSVVAISWYDRSSR